MFEASEIFKYVVEAEVVESFAFKAFCKSVWSERIPVIAPQATVALLLLVNAHSNPVGEVEDDFKNVPGFPAAILIR